jgi:hypothetical protein
MFNSKIKSILWSTLIVGILDALAAIIVYGIFYKYNPIQIYQFVSSALLGNDAYNGGIPIALLGLTFHFFVAFLSSYLFIELYPQLAILRQNKIIGGLTFGFIVWVVMNLIIIPLTKIPASKFDIVSVLAILWHMFLVGLPISIIAQKFYSKRNRPKGSR